MNRFISIEYNFGCHQLFEDLVSAQPCMLYLHALNRIRISGVYLRFLIGKTHHTHIQVIQFSLLKVFLIFNSVKK